MRLDIGCSALSNGTITYMHVVQPAFICTPGAVHEVISRTDNANGLLRVVEHMGCQRRMFNLAYND